MYGRGQITSSQEMEDAGKLAEKATKPIAVEIRRDRSEKIIVLKPHDTL